MAKTMNYQKVIMSGILNNITDINKRKFVQNKLKFLDRFTKLGFRFGKVVHIYLKEKAVTENVNLVCEFKFLAGTNKINVCECRRCNGINFTGMFRFLSIGGGRTFDLDDVNDLIDFDNLILTIASF